MGAEGGSALAISAVAEDLRRVEDLDQREKGKVRAQRFGRRPDAHTE